MGIKKIVDFIVAVRFDKLPSNVITQAKVAARDNLGVIVAAHKDKAVSAARRIATAMGGRDDSTMIGIGIKVPCNVASMVNAVMGSTLDMDDGGMGPAGGRGHPGGMIVPSSLAVAEYQNATGKDLIEALVVGYEVAVRTAGMIWETDKPIKGRLRRNAGISGPYGVAAAVAKLLRLKPEEITNALGIAEAHAPFPPLIDTATGPAMTKEAMGWASMTGVTAALLAQAGFTGPITIYDHPEYPKEPWENLGLEWEMLNLYFKPYSMCRLYHTPIDGVLQIIRKHNLKADDVLKVTVRVTPYGGRPFQRRPSTIWQAQYSTPFGIGAALVDGEVGPEQIAEDRLNDKEILSQADKVELVIDPEVEALLPYPFLYGSKVEIEIKDGRNFETFIRCPRGDPRNPLTNEELSGKFMKLAARGMGFDRAKDLRKCLDRLENLDNVKELIQKVSRLE